MSNEKRPEIRDATDAINRALDYVESVHAEGERAATLVRLSMRILRGSWFVLAGALGALVGAAVIYWKAAP